MYYLCIDQTNCAGTTKCVLSSSFDRCFILTEKLFLDPALPESKFLPSPSQLMERIVVKVSLSCRFRLGLICHFVWKNLHYFMCNYFAGIFLVHNYTHTCIGMHPAVWSVVCYLVKMISPCCKNFF